MLEVIRRYREMRPASMLVIIVALIFGGYNVHRALGFGAHVDQVPVSAASPLASRNASQARFGEPVFTKADRSTLKSVETLTRIEELQVGERIRSDAPTDEFDLQFGIEINPSEWRKLTLIAPKRDGSSADVVLLRPLQWQIEQQAEVGGTVFISVPECGINGHANVLAIDPCPLIEPAGDLGGRVITGTFRHQVSASISLSIAGQAEPILCTGNHPFWSEDRHDFVRADSLQPYEKLRTTTGTTTVTSLSHIPGSTPVYNLEVHGTHVYHVGTSGVLVHNGDPEDCIKWAQRMRDQIDGEVVHMLPGNGAPVIGKLPGYDAVRIQDGMIPGWKQHAMIIKDGKIFDAVHPNGIPAGEWFGKYMELNGFKSVTEMLDWVRFKNLWRGFTG